MRLRAFIWILLCLLCLAGAWLLWHQPANTRTKPSALLKAAVPTSVTVQSASTAPKILTAVSTNAATSAKTNQFAWRLSNTSKTIGQLVGDRHAILLENALIDTGAKLNFSIPKNLQSQGDPGAYIVQARGPIDNAFRAMLAAAGAEIVSYIPNDAYLVRAPAGVANGLAAQALVQAVIPYEPYYKIQSSMLTLAVGQMVLPDGTVLNLGLFGDNAQQTIQEIEKLGGKVLAQDRSPFGPVVRVQPPADWVALATLPGVQIIEPSRKRAAANDLSRVTTGVSADTLVPTNYLNLNGLNVVVEVNDFGIDATHPDFAATTNGGASRVIGDPANLVDTDGHGTHVAGIIAGNGSMSSTVTNAPGSVINANFRGKAQLATLLSMNQFTSSDQELQEAAARTNALISNNSWYYEGDSTYDLAAASYDAAVRDALPQVTGSQPVLFVFAAGNAGNGDDTTDPGSGTSDSIESPATAKNVITVGAIQEFRDITNIVTEISSDGTTNTSTPWEPETSTSYRVAGFSSRGNVGIGIEGTYGRYKPDVVAPGTFVLSTRSEQWDTASYFYINPTNHDINGFGNLVLQPGGFWANVFPIVPNNAVQAAIYVEPNADSPVPFPDLAVYFGLASAAAYTFNTVNNQVLIPPDGGLTIVDILNTESFYGFNYAVSNTTTQPISFDVVTDVVTTNNPGDYFLVLSNLNQSIGTFNPANTNPGPYYRYESGTSMSAAGVSGVLALMQDYFTNTLHLTPSPALLKAMLINGARPTGYYDFQVQNVKNYEGWGLVNLTNSLPPGMTNQLNAACASFFVDQSPASALATGDSHTYMMTVDTNTDAQYLPLQVTLVWTDPPGDPAAAIKLVNNLDLVVTNFDDPANQIVYYGNDIPASSIYNSPENPTNPPNFDAINNVENVFLSPLLGSHYSVTVIGRSVNVNAVTAHTNNVAQDYVLVISCGEGEVTNAFTVTTNATSFVSNPTSDQQITFVTSTNKPLLNQFVGASTPLLGTNTIQLTGGTELNGIQLGGTNLITLGMTNQWHFYVVANTGAADFTNAAFITFIPDTLSIPRMGVFADSVDNATRPEADIDLYVSTNPGLTNLDPMVISNADKSVGRGGTEFVYYTNSAPGKVYYVGVYSEDQEASEYGFIPIFTDIPFSQPGPNGSQIVNGLVLPVNIPDGSPAHPGSGYIFALAINPMEVKRVTVTSTITHQKFGDLIGTFAHGQQNGGSSKTIVLNNHDSLYDPSGFYTQIYDDSGQGDITGSRPSDGPGSLNSFLGQQAIGPWILTEVDDSLTQTGSVTGFNLLIEPHQDLTKGLYGTVAGGSWFYDFIDVPAGATSLTVSATNLTLPPLPLQLFVRLDAEPTLTNFDATVILANGIPPGGTISIGPPLTPGRYWVGIWNPNVTAQNFYLIAKLGVGAVPGQVIFSSSGPAPILDDAVMTNSIFVTANQTISSVEAALRVDHPRVSDLVFHLISPDGTHCLLVENRGGTTTNGMGTTLAITNITPATSSGDGSASTNFIDTGSTAGTVQISYNFYGIPDEMVVQYQGTNVFDSGIISGSGVFTIAYGPGTNTQLTIIMNPTVNPGVGDLWDYTVNSSQVKYTYLVLTEDTNKTTTPIKFAPVPFVPAAALITPTNVFSDGFEGAATGDYINGQTFVNGWTVITNQVTVINDPATAEQGNNLLALADGVISNTLPTVAGRTYTLTFAYRGPNAVSMWRGESNAVDSISGNNGSLINDISYAAGEVNSAFSMGANGFVSIPASPSLDLGSGGFTIDAWVDPTAISASSPNPIVEWSDPADYAAGVQFYVSSTFQNAPGCLFAGFQDSHGGATWFTSPMNIVTNNGFQHVALTVNHKTGNSALYLDGNVVATANLGNLVPWTSMNVLIGRRINLTVPSQNFHFAGKEDEISVYGRDLSASEIKAIYNHGGNGKFDPAAPSIAQGLAEAQVTVSGSNSPAFFGNNTNWQTTTITFTATQINTPLQITGIEPGMLLDNFVLTQMPAGGDLYYLPEQSLDTFTGESAQGQWQLEVWDNRAGAGLTNTLVSWQLRFNFPTASGSIGTLTNGTTLTNVIPAGGIAYYLITVPANADIATNILISPNGPLNLWFNQTTPPSGTGSPGDYLLFTGSTNGTAILYTNGTPPLIPGSTYYLGVQNTNTFAVTNYSITVDFHLIPVPIVLTNGQPQTNTVPAGGIDYYLVNVPTNADWATNLLLFAGGPLNVWFNPTNLPAATNPPDILLFGGATTGIAIFGTNSIPTNIVPGGTYYLAVQNTNSGAVTYGIEVDFHTQTPIVITNSTPITNSIPINGITQVMVVVPTNALWASNILISATGPINVWFNQTNPPTGSTNTGDFLMFSATNAGVFVLTGSSVPPLVPGTNYFLGFQNLGASNVTFVFQVVFGFAPINPVSNFTITATNIGGTNGFLLTWYAPTNDYFQVEWTGGLNPPITWNTFSNIVGYTTFITPTNSRFTFFDDGSQTGGFGPMRFYRLILLQSTNVLTLPFQVNRTIDALTLLVVTNTATDSDTNATLSYVLTTTVAGLPAPGIDANGIITWTPALAQAGTVNTFTTVVTDNGLPPISATNSFTVTVNPLPMLISSAMVTTNGFFQLQWSAPTNYQFQVAWTTNLMPPVVWNYIPPGPPYITSVTTNFTFVDTNAPTAMKFYRLVEYP